MLFCAVLVTSLCLSYVTYTCTSLRYMYINPLTCAVVGTKDHTLLYGLKVYKHAYIHITHMHTPTLYPLSCPSKVPFCHPPLLLALDAQTEEETMFL